MKRYKSLRSSIFRKRFDIFISAALVAVLFVLPHVAVASPYVWTGGHDVQGWPDASEKMFFAEGTTRNGFEEYLILRNPDDITIDIEITYYFQAPENPLTEKRQLAPGAGLSILVNDAVGPDKDVSIGIEASAGIIGERQMYFNYKGVWPGGHVSSGVPEPSDIWYFAEGATHAGFNEWVCLQNPAAEATDVKLTFMLGSGETIVKDMKVEANSRSTVDVSSMVGSGQDVSLMVESGIPIIAERPMYFDYKGSWRGGHIAAGATGLGREWNFAEGTTRNGFEEWLCIMNPGEETTARVEYLFADSPSQTLDYTLQAQGRTTIFVNGVVGPEKEVSIKVTTQDDVVCERPMYFDYHLALEGGHVIVGSTEGSCKWLLPTSAVGSGFESYLCVMCPGEEDNSIKVELFNTDGAHVEKYYELAPKSRMTLSLNELSSGVPGSWVKVTGAEEIIVERPSYFSYAPAVEPDPFILALWNGIEIKSPVCYCDYIGAVYHEAYPTGSGGLADNCQVLQPAGICLRDDNPARWYPGLVRGLENDPAYFVESSRGRGTFSTTACDIIAKAGTTVYAPVSGTVIAAESYMLYGSYPDLRIRIAIDGHPGYHMAVLHMSSLNVTKGQRVEAGVTPVGVVRDLVPYFNSGPNPYTREEGNHAHIQLNYRPDMGLGYSGQYAGASDTP